MRWSWPGGATLQRSNEGDALSIPAFTVSCGDGQVCGTVNITGSVTSSGTDIQFTFVPSEDPAECCCTSYGWIQHVCDNGGWAYDNNARGGRRGAPSQPDKRPQGPPDDKGRWKPNPWYGGPGDVTDAKNEEIDDLPDDEKEDARDRFAQRWPKKPKPQTTIRDRPGGQVLGFVTQLVCVESGKVLFSYTWVQHKSRNTGWDYRFVGGEGDNLEVVP